MLAKITRVVKTSKLRLMDFMLKLQFSLLQNTV